MCKNFSKIVLAVIIWSCSLGNGAELTDIDCYYVFPTVLVFPETAKNVKIDTTRFIKEKVCNTVCELNIYRNKLLADRSVIIAARGEAEPVQFVIETRNKKLTNVKLKCSDLFYKGHKFSSDNIDIRVVGYTKFKGKLWPDPLFPQQESGVDILANMRQAWWITVTVPENQLAGVYEGTIEIVCGVKRIKSMPFVVEIAKFSFPKPLPMGVSIGLGIEKPALRMALERHFYPHNHRVGVAMPIFKIDDSGNVILDFREFDKRVSYLRKVYGMKYICLGYIMGDGGGTEYWKTSLYPQAIDASGKRIKICIDPRKGGKCRERFCSVMQQYVKHLEKKGWLSDSFIYLWDEPHKKELIKLANEFGEYFKQLAPKLPLMVTGYIKNCDIVCSLVNHCSDQSVAKCKKEKKRYWIYSCGDLQDPSLTVGKPALDSRLFGWIGFRYHAENFLYWGITINYQKTKLIDKIIFEKTPGGGDGVLFYCSMGRYKRVIPSIRSENLRDGVEDAIILDIAEKSFRGEKNFRNRVKKLIPTQHNYNVNPSKYMLIRSDIYKLLSARH